jgi:hypothetical protein
MLISASVFISDSPFQNVETLQMPLAKSRTGSYTSSPSHDFINQFRDDTLFLRSENFCVYFTCLPCEPRIERQTLEAGDSDFRSDFLDTGAIPTGITNALHMVHLLAMSLTNLHLENTGLGFEL